VTTRLFQIVQAIGLATGGMLGARLADRFRMETSWMTILRRMMALPTEPVKQVSQLGIDDFAFRRGCKYGTILVDMITHQVIDMLPDRTSATSAAWMAAHPEIELVSRDRGGDYASAARAGAPQAIQCADSFHLLKNLGETLEGMLAHHLAAHRTCQAEQLSATSLEGAQPRRPSSLSSKGSTAEAGEARGAPCSIPASRDLTQARLLADGLGFPSWDRPCHGLALLGQWHVSRTTTAATYDRS